MKTVKKENICYGTELTIEDIKAIKRSEEEFERGECIDFEEVFERLRNRYPESKIYN